MEAVDVADGVIDGSVESRGVGAAVGEGQESVARSVGESRT